MVLVGVMDGPKQGGMQFWPHRYQKKAILGWDSKQSVAGDIRRVYTLCLRVPQPLGNKIRPRARPRRAAMDAHKKTSIQALQNIPSIT